MNTISTTNTCANRRVCIVINLIAARYVTIGVLYVISPATQFAYWLPDKGRVLVPACYFVVGLSGLAGCLLGRRGLATLFAVGALMQSAYRILFLVILGHVLEPLIALFAVEAMAMIWLIYRLQQWKFSQKHS